MHNNPHTKRTILIAGCGYLGQAVGASLAQHGHKVLGLRRHPESTPGVTPLRGDLLDPATLDLPPGLDAVVYTAAATRPDDAAYEAVYVRGLTNLLARLAADGHAPQRLIYTSSTGVYGQDDGAWVDEDSDPAPTSPRGRLLLAAERIWASAPWPAVVVRLSGLYGPGRTRMIRRVREGTRAPAGRPQWTNRIHRDDAAGFIAHLLDLPRCEGLYLGTDSRPALDRDVEAFIATRLGLPPAALPPPDATPGNKRCRNDRLVASGYALRYPSFEEGYGALLAAELAT